MMILRILLVVILMTGCNKKDPAENNNPLNGTFTSSIDVNGQVPYDFDSNSNTVLLRQVMYESD